MLNEKHKKNFIQAGLLAKETRAYGKSLIIPGASYNEVIAKINRKIFELGAKPAFPPQIALNEVAAHFLPIPGEDVIFSDELIKLDVGVCYQGAIGDCAVSLDLSGKHQSLIDAAEAALLAAEQYIEVGKTIGGIGKTIEETIARFGYKPVKNLSGHGLGYNKIHTPPGIPNYNDGSKELIKEGMTFAIEPFVTNGYGLIQEKGKAMIFTLIKASNPKSTLHQALITQMKAYQGLPFAMHEFMGKEIPLEEVMQGFDDLLKAGIIYGYPPLVEKANGMVAQAENSVLVDNQGKVTITTR